MSQIRHLPSVRTHAETHAAGHRIERHWHDDHQLVHVSTGVLAIETARGAWVASSERAVWIPAGTWHEHRFHGRSSFHSLRFAVDDAPDLGDTPAVLAVDGLTRELIVAATDPQLAPEEGRRLRAVLHDRLHRAEQRPFSLPSAQDHRLAAACALVVEDLSRPRSMAWLARRAGAGERTLARLFRAEFGTTYPQWRTDVRIFHALVLLAEGANVTETAHRCGWATTSAFVDTFARVMGRTPGSYRNVGDR